jgi:hypothetical protein
VQPFEVVGQAHEVPFAADFVIDGEGRERQPLDGADDEVHQIILSDPVAQVGRQEHGSVAVDVLETMSHGELPTPNPSRLPSFESFAEKKSDRLLSRKHREQP